MMLEFILDVFKTYLPIILGCTYLYSYEKLKIENLVKFFVLRTLLSLLEFILVDIFLFQ